MIPRTVSSALVRRLVAGSFVGTCAFLLTAFLTTIVSHGRLIAVNDPVREVGTLTGTLFPPLWKVGGWVFFGAHLVSVRPLASAEWGSDALLSSLFWLYQGPNFPPAVPLSPLGGEQPVRNLVMLMFDGPTIVALLCIPPVILGFAGVLFSRRYGETYQDSGVAGCWLLAGYLPCSLFLAVFTRTTIAGYGYTATVGVSLFDAVLLAGVIYPVVFGGMGGLINRGLVGAIHEKLSDLHVGSHVKSA